MKRTQQVMILIAALSLRLNAQETTRRIVISLSDRKLVLLDGERVVKIFDTAVGKPIAPTPEGEFEVVNRIPHPTWFGGGRPVPPGKAKHDVAGKQSNLQPRAGATGVASNHKQPVPAGTAEARALDIGVHQVDDDCVERRKHGQPKTTGTPFACSVNYLIFSSFATLPSRT